MERLRPLRAAAATAAMIALWASCRTVGTRLPVAGELASCVPPGTLALAGVNLDQLRASALYRQLPPGASAFLEPLRNASYMLLAYNGRDVLAIARGAFREAPPGAVLLASDLAVSGSPQAIRAATAQRKTGQTGARWLFDRAAGAVDASQVWAIAQGGMTFPLAGDAANLNRFLQLVEYGSIAIRLDSPVRIDIAGAGRTAESAQQLEDTLRAFFSVAAAGASRDRDLAGLLRSVHVQRDGLTVRATIAVAPGQAAKLVPLLSQ